MTAVLQPHLLAFWMILGLVLLTVEVAAFGMASGVLLFASIGSLLTGMVLALGLVPDTVQATLACFAASSALSAALLWRPLKRFQDTEARHEPTSDLVGHRFRIEQDIAVAAPGTVRYSGVAWRVEIAPECPEPSLQAGSLVEVVSVDAGLFRVKPAS